MGIPKFFRWMSERYPMCSQLIEPNSIPEFDNLYLDMNGIIHNSTHKGDYGISGSLTEEKMYMAIFNYIEHLFTTIKPKKLFFMAIDGCAPRAKMNQQRSRRFRTAKDAHDARQAAIKKGEELPKEDPFDSNCITPGTVFMSRLSKQLKYFVNKKVSEDSDWRGVTIVLSGHDVPGEGEHKIMEYIRAAKVQPDYDPNVRECLYGLDADLIMLGLLSHEPHFCLLREEVNFGPVKAGSKTKELDAQNFFLMHLSLLREYLELEFQELRQTLPFEYDLERIIDDFILLAFFVGNDFLPNLPNLHINEGALALMYKVYKETIPACGGYMNDNGVIDRKRLSKMLEGLEKFEKQYFEAESHDASYFKSKEGGHLDSIEQAQAVNRLIMTEEQKQVFNQAKGLVKKQQGDTSIMVKSDEDTMQKFVEQICKDLSLTRREVSMEEEGTLVRFNKLSLNTISGKQQNGVQEAIARYSKAPVVKSTIEEAEAEMQRAYDEKFDAWRSEYYKEKLGFGIDDEAALTKMAENYCEGLQWVLYYYYRGVVSWGWYYGYHYSPKISDVRKGLQRDFKFEIGKPFKPFEQLMGVLPERSKKLVPECLQELMVDDISPIKDFYPNDFPLDMNGKKADWEAVVKIPFIDEKRLLDAMASKSNRLTNEERSRNVHGPAIQFIHDDAVDIMYPSSFPGFFPDLRSHCRMTTYELPSMDGRPTSRGLTEGVVLGKESLAGFPSLHTLAFSGSLDFHGINVFQRDSKNETMVVKILPAQEQQTSESIARRLIGQNVYVGWPYLQEARVVAVSDEMFRYEKSNLNGSSSAIVPIPQHDNSQWHKSARRLQERLSKKLGIITGPIDVLCHVAPLKGLMRTDDGAFVKEFVSEARDDTDYPLQCVVNDVVDADTRYMEREALDVTQEFPIGQKAFFLGEFNYGRPARVVGHTNDKVDILVSALKTKEADFAHQIADEAVKRAPYFPAPAVCKVVGMSALCLSKLTSSFTVVVDDDRVNLGLNLKFEGKRMKVLGYTRRNQVGWEYSDKAVALLQDYKSKFPAFIANLERKARNDMFVATDFFAANEAKQKIKEISTWLKAVATKSFERVPLEAQELDLETIKQIEIAANECNVRSREVIPTTVKSVPRKALLKPEDAVSRLKHQTFILGDRVSYVADSGKVPIATRGTVIGVHKDSLDIVFDTAFMSGTVLGGRCSEYRGMTVTYYAVLNISNPTVLAASKAGKHQPKHQQQQQQQGFGQAFAANGARNGPQKLLARNTANANGQYYDSNAPQNNAWQQRSNQQFMNNMLKTYSNGPTNGAQSVPAGARPHHTTADGLQRQPAGPQQNAQNGFATRGRGRGRGGRGRGAANGVN